MALLELGDCHMHHWLSEASPGHFAPPQELEQLLLLTFSPSFRHSLSIELYGFGKQRDHEDQELQLPSNAEINYRQKVSSFRVFLCQCRIGTARFLSLPQHWVLQLLSWSASPAHVEPPQEGAGLEQVLKSWSILIYECPCFTWFWSLFLRHSFCCKLHNQTRCSNRRLQLEPGLEQESVRKMLLHRLKQDLYSPQQWVLQAASCEEVPAQDLPPQEGLGFVQDLNQKIMISLQNLSGSENALTNLVLFFFPPPQALLQLP